MAAFPIHFQPSTLRPGLACDELLADLPPEHTAPFRLADGNCESCLDAVTNPPVLAARSAR
jgi:hypothetical protein